ncbi:MAG: DUF6067 family protein [Planctomycetota bacterium]|nr:DUF6067 family protein [Planctomycetota bacterium]
MKNQKPETRNLQLQSVLGVLGVLAVCCSGMAAEDFRVPLMKQAPKIDGTIEPQEWSAAAGFDGFITLNDGKLQRRRARGFIGATETHLYVAIQSQLPDEGALLAEIKTDSLKAVYDDAAEVFVCPTPDATDKVDYQFLTNSLGKGGYNIHVLGAAKEDVAWRGDYQQAHGQHDGWWHLEAAIPLAKLGAGAQGRKATDGVWAVNVCRDWKPDWAWSSLSGAYPHSGLKFAFTTDAAPGVRFEWSKDPSVPPVEGQLTVCNPCDKPLELKASLSLVRNNMPELKEEKTLKLAPGASETLKMAVAENDPTTVFDLTVLVTSADGKTVYHKRQTKWSRAKEPYRWVIGKPKDAPPVDFRFSYYPSKNKMRLAADINGLPKNAKPSRVTAVVRQAQPKKDVKTIDLPVDKFKDGRQEASFDLPALDGEYEIAVAVEGENCPKGETIKTFERKVFPWENLAAGRSTKVYPPFTPIWVGLKDGSNTLRTALRDHTLNDAGLLDQVVAKSATTGVAKPLLAAPMRYVVKAGGAELAVQAQPLTQSPPEPHREVTEGAVAAGPLKAKFSDTWDYDGTVRVDLTLQPTDGKAIDELTLEIPFLAEAATMIHANSDRIRAPVAQKIPEGDGVVWDARKVACDDFIKNFCPYIYIGGPVRGLCWFAENDKGWGWNPATPNLEVVRKGGQVILRVHLINQPTTITEPRTISFGMLAAPVKPMLDAPGQNPNWWRYRFIRDKYHLLGTDINWLALGDCGSVYPAGQDMFLWEMLKKGNLEKISDADVKATVERCKKLFEQYGKDAVKTWEAHVGHNLHSHLGAKMVFYYNRATCQLFPECETFKDEWLLDDYRVLGKGNSRGEIKVVPSPSYTDYNLYWYAKSFEIANNQGVYWDNYFICPSFNTEMTEAYKRADGSIVPAAGIWALRDLAKRTFIMMNEREMLPIVFPHMTSFNPLPMMSFCTVQYEWEWKYSEGDVHDRFTRDYILLATTGEQAGVWPVPLGDAGKLADDPWTQRTFTAVRLVHELDGYGGWGNGWVKSHQENAKVAQHVLDMLDKEGLQVYKYWDDRPQPVKAANPDIVTIVYSVPGKEAVAAVTSYSTKDEQATLDVDAKALGFAGGCTVTNVETGEEVQLQDGKLAFPLKKHELRVLRVMPKGAK